MAKEIKQEYALIMAQKYGSTTYYYHWFLNKGKVWRGFIDYAESFPTIEKAKEKLIELQKEGIFTETKNLYICDNTSRREIARFISNKVWNNNDAKGIFILRVPTAYYIGDNWEQVLLTKSCDFYTNEKPYYLYGHKDADILGKDHFLRYVSPTNFDWVENKEDATFFDLETSEKVLKIINDIRSKEIPYKGYVRCDKMPLHLDFEPKYHKWDIAYMIDYERQRITKHRIWDVKPIFIHPYPYNRHKVGYYYQYEISNNPWAFDEPIEKELLTMQDLIAMGAVFNGKKVTFKGKDIDPHSYLARFTFYLDD